MSEGAKGLVLRRSSDVEGDVALLAVFGVAPKLEDRVLPDGLVLKWVGAEGLVHQLAARRFLDTSKGHLGLHVGAHALRLAWVGVVGKGLADIPNQLCVHGISDCSRGAVLVVPNL